MCLAPKLVSRVSSTRGDRLTALNIVKGDCLKRYKCFKPAGNDFFMSNMLVPCGKCSQCLKKRQNSLAARCSIEANKRGSMVFVTLTYRNDTVPLTCHLMESDLDSGEILSCGVSSFDSKRFLDRDSDFYKDCIYKLNMQDKHSVRYVNSDLLDFDGKNYSYVVTQSLCRRDVQLWIKRCRVAYVRELKLPLKKFSYVICGEMGTHTHRPHYHIAFFGLSKVIVDWMAARWNREFGFTYVERVNPVNPDGTNGFDLCSKYIGKYMSKGSFDCESVKDGFAQKPRLMCSLGLGRYSDTEAVSPEVLSYYRCYDLVGEYHINTGIKKDGSVLSSADYDLIASELPKRSVFKIGSNIYPIPNYIKHFVWYEKNADGRMVASFVRKEISSRLQVDFFENFVRELTEDYSREPTSEIYSTIFGYIESRLSSNQIAEDRGRSSLQNFYSKSIF